MKIRLEDAGSIELSEWSLWFDYSQEYSTLIAGLKKSDLKILKKLVEQELKRK